MKHKNYEGLPLFRKMEEKGYPVKRAVVYETPNNCAAYRETEEETEAVWL